MNGDINPITAIDSLNSGNTRKRVVKDMIILFVLSAISFVIAVYFELFEEFMELSRDYEEWELDEFVSILIILPFAFAAFAFRRWQDLNAEIIQRSRAEEMLKESYEKLERSNEELQTFLSIASHDLQEPLRKVSVIGNRLEAQYADGLGEQGRDYVGRIVRSIKNMSGFISALQNYSIVATRPGKFKSVNLTEVMRQVVTDHQSIIELVEGSVDLEDLPTVDADSSQMYQLFQNLISNAIKYRKEDIPPVVKVYSREIRTKNHNSPNGNAQNGLLYKIFIEDNGIGFDDAYAKKIFGVFQSVHRRDDNLAAGIGLPVCKKIVEKHAGNIEAKSREGDGATFIVTLPQKQQGESRNM